MEFLEDALCKLMIECKIICKDDDVVDVYCDIFHGDFLLQNVIHYGLKGAGCIAESEHYNHRFVESLMHNECSLLSIAFPNLYIIITLSEVEQSEDWGLREAVNEVGDSQNGELVFLGDYIEGIVVLDQMYASILFRDKEDRC